MTADLRHAINFAEMVALRIRATVAPPTPRPPVVEARRSPH